MFRWIDKLAGYSKSASTRITLVTFLNVVCWQRPALADETWGYVVDWFHVATIANADTCPQGVNPLATELARQTLRGLGYSNKKIEEMLSGDGSDIRTVMALRGKLEGKPAQVYTYPKSVPDSKIKTAHGRQMYGFNLDGKVGPQDFVEPDTGEAGIDNNLFKAVGCYADYHITLPTRPFYDAVSWNFLKDNMPAWVFSVTGKSLNADGPVTVVMTRSHYHMERDANGEALKDATFVLDENPRSINRFAGSIKDGVLTIEPGPLFMEGEMPILDKLRLSNTRLRLALHASGRAEGYIGGYQPWLDFYFYQAGEGGVREANGMDIPGLYYALERLADSDLDPKSGRFKSISATYRIEAVPAFLVKSDSKIVAVPGYRAAR